MAGDWIPVRKGLKDELEVMRIATLTGLSRRVVVSVLIDFWSWCDSVTEDGTLKGVTLDQMSAICPDIVRGFWEALAQVGWIVLSDDGAMIPNYDRWLGSNAKKRLKEALRKRDKRYVGGMSAFRPRNVPPKRGQKADKKRTTEQNRTEQINTPFPPSIDNQEIRELWAQWQAHRREIHKPLTPTAATRQLAKLAEMGPARATAALAHSIANGYQGVYEPTVRPGDGLKPPVSTETPQERAARTLRQRQQAEEERRAAEAERERVRAKLEAQRRKQNGPPGSPDEAKGSDGRLANPEGL